MRIKISLLIIVIICFLAFIVNDTPLTSTKTPVKVKKFSQTKALDATHSQVTEDGLPIKTTIKAKDTELETSGPTFVYDADPVIEAQLLIENNKSCYQQLSNKKEMNKYSELIELKFSIKQKSFYDSFKKYCEELNELHPELKLTNIIRVKKQQRKLVATSQWGEIMTGEIDVATLSDYEISTILKKNDLNILSQAPIYLREYYQEIIHWQLEDVLQNHQYDYINYIQKLTHQLYLCELGADCSITSTVMVNLCYQNSMNCGLDYPLFIQSTLTQGQQSDIQLALVYLKGQYQ
jgi:hypothetical protein